MREGFIGDAFEQLANRHIRSSSMNIANESYAFDSAALLRKSEDPQAPGIERNIQEVIRPNFGKTGVNTSKIGTHPDFEYLENTDEHEHHYICSIFLDIKNSTRLSHLYSLEEVSDIKNTILKASSEVVRAFDGHVHRFMGDALLAFFGGKQLTKEDSIINTINCVVLLQSIMTDTIIPSLVERGYSIHHLGFRIGFDFGDDNQVLWRSFGFNDVREITATSFSVDFSAKLQSYASKNQSMLGERLIKFIDFPEKYTSIKKIIKNGETEDLSSKTYTGKDGESIKYNFRQLNHELYRDLLPYPVKVKSALASSKTIYSPGFELTCINKNSQEIIRSVSKCHEKQVDILFKLNLTAACYKDESIFPLTITFVKCNNGEEARKRNEEKEVTVINKIHPYPAGTHGFFHGETIKVNETTLYRGLHTMTVEVKTKLGLPIFKDFFGIYII